MIMILYIYTYYIYIGRCLAMCDLVWHTASPSARGFRATAAVYPRLPTQKWRWIWQMIWSARGIWSKVSCSFFGGFAEFDDFWWFLMFNLGGPEQNTRSTLEEFWIYVEDCPAKPRFKDFCMGARWDNSGLIQHCMLICNSESHNVQFIKQNITHRNFRLPKWKKSL